MRNAAEKLMSLDEFLAWEREQPERHEFSNGVVTMITGASLAHVTLSMNLVQRLRQSLRGSGCRPFSSDAKVIANGAVRYPDVSVTCQPIIGTEDIVPEPVVVIEVISRSTERVDRGHEKIDYFATPSIRQYAIVEQDERLVDRYTRADNGWINEVVTDAGVVNLTSIGVELPLDAIYEDTDLDATRLPASALPSPAR